MKEEKNWHYTVYDTGKSDSVMNSVVVWNFEIVLLLKFLYYTDSYVGRVDRVANRVVLKTLELYFRCNLILHGSLHGLPKPCLKPCGDLEILG